MDLLKSHISQTEELIEKSIENYENNIESREKIYDEFHSSVTDFYLGIDSDTYFLDEIFKEYFPNLKRQSVLILICSYMENELYKLCNMVQQAERIQFDIKDIDSSKGKLDKIKQYYKKTFIKNYSKEFELKWNFFHNCV